MGTMPLPPLPQVRIKDATLLRANASVYLNELWGKGKRLRKDQEYHDITEAYKKAWQPYEQKILTGMSDILDLKFRQVYIDVYIAPWFSAFSDPLVIGVLNEPDIFVDTLTHEIIHRLLMDNTTVPHELQLVPEWEKMFGKDHAFNTLVHIPVHAVHKALILDIMHEPERLERELEAYKKATDWDPRDYMRAWEYVDQHGYKTIIRELRKSYKQLSS